MKAIAILVVLIAACAFAEYVEEDDVIVVTTDNFEELLEKFDAIMVEFYAPWCGHCKTLAPEYAKAAKTLKERGDNYVPLGKCDATIEEALATKFEVKGFPTLKFFSKAGGAEPLTYEGARQAADIVSYVNKKTGSASVLLNTLADLTKALEKLEAGPVAVFFATSEDDKDLSTFLTVARASEGISFYHTTSQEARESHSLAGDVKVVLFKNFDDLKNVFEGALTTEDLTAFLALNSIPTVLPFNEKAIQAIFQQQQVGFFLFANDNEESVRALQAFSSVAGQFKTQIKFAFSKPNDGFGLFTRLAEYVGADQTKLPNLMLVDPSGGNAKYRFELEPTAENIQTFVTSYLSGSLTRHLKSEPIPETNDEPVKVVVGKNFDELVINNDKDVLVEFYAPWCGHCKTLAPIYEDLAIQLAKVNPNIVLAKMDSTANEVPGVDVQSFPTLKFWKNGSKDTAIDYSGERDFNGLLAFLKDKTSHAFVNLESHEDL